MIQKVNGIWQVCQLEYQHKMHGRKSGGSRKDIGCGYSKFLAAGFSLLAAGKLPLL